MSSDATSSDYPNVSDEVSVPFGVVRRAIENAAADANIYREAAAIEALRVIAVDAVHEAKKILELWQAKYETMTMQVEPRRHVHTVRCSQTLVCTLDEASIKEVVEKQSLIEAKLEDIVAKQISCETIIKGFVEKQADDEATIEAMVEKIIDRQQDTLRNVLRTHFHIEPPVEDSMILLMKSSEKCGALKPKLEMVETESLRLKHELQETQAELQRLKMLKEEIKRGIQEEDKSEDDRDLSITNASGQDEDKSKTHDLELAFKALQFANKASRM
ncbi:hypothetical protein JCM11491_003115 [Sporobolomyces phaffii]